MVLVYPTILVICLIYLANCNSPSFAANQLLGGIAEDIPF
jgi:hypothetical protein